MTTKPLLLVTLSLLLCGVAMADEGPDLYVRIAELETDPAHAAAFATAVREVGQASARSEEGCLVLYAVESALSRARPPASAG
jgi:hypothetical protein